MAKPAGKQRFPLQARSFVDCRGKTFRVGDTVAFPTMQGQSASLVVGEVMRINTTTNAGAPLLCRNEKTCSLTLRPIVRSAKWGVNADPTQRLQTYQDGHRCVLIERRTSTDHEVKEILAELVQMEGELA